ncbi:MAG TPA: NADP-dependent oxidoreductase [Pseudosphingobacterium sp.]|nr:NADP-dependent oxidoreductase [Pseudosphingobacterium sp.]
MKAIILKDFGGVEHFLLDEVIPLPKIGKDEVLVEIKASAFNPIDYQMRQGRPESKKMRSFILGREFSGRVIEVGSDVKKFKKGDDVLAAAGSMGSNGTYASHIGVPEAIIVHKPMNMSYEIASAVPVAGLTAIQCLNRLPLSTDDSIFVSGAAGGVGLMLIKLLLANGYFNIVVTAGNEESKSKLVALGLSSARIIDYKHPKLREEICQINKNGLFKSCIDLVGNHMSEICASLLTINGYYMDVTALTTVGARAKLFDKGATIINISNYTYSLEGDFAYYGKQLKSVVDLLNKKLISPPPVKVVGDFSVCTVRKAHEMLEKNLSKGNKLVMLHNE